MTARISQSGPIVEPTLLAVPTPPPAASRQEAAPPLAISDQAAFLPHQTGSGLPAISLMPMETGPRLSDSQVLGAATGRGTLMTPRVGCFNPGTPVTVTLTSSGYHIEIGGFEPRTVQIGRLSLAMGRLSTEQREAIELVRSALANTPQIRPEGGPLAPPPWPPIRLPGGGPVVQPPGLDQTVASVKPTDRADLEAAVDRGTMGHAGGCTNPGPGAVCVTRTGTGFNIRLTTGGIMRHSRDVHVSLADLQSGKLTQTQRRALDRLHDQLNGNNRPPVPPIAPRPWPLPLEPRPQSPLPWPRPIERPDPGPQVTVTDVAARISDLEEGLRMGYLGRTGCTSPGGALEITRTADGFKLTSLSGGIITHRREVEISLADLRRGTLTQAQLAALDDLRRKLADAETEASVKVDRPSVLGQLRLLNVPPGDD